MRSESILSINHSSVCKGAAHSRPCTFTDPTIVVDVREKLPYRFPGAVTKFLPVGDYSVLHRENDVAVERKSKRDAYRSLGHRRERFRREIERLATYRYPAVVIECTLAGFLIPPPFGGLHPQTALDILLSWSAKFRLPIHFAGDRENAEALTRKFLERAAWYATQEDCSVG